MSLPSYLSSFNQPNKIWRAGNAMKLFNMQFYPPSIHFLFPNINENIFFINRNCKLLCKFISKSGNKLISAQKWIKLRLGQGISSTGTAVISTLQIEHII
jgi:hypothetical protein